MNVKGSIDLMKLKNAGVMTINGKTGTKKCVVIPIDENDLYVKNDDAGRSKNAYLGINIWERRSVSAYGATHYIKQNFSKEFRDSHTKEEMDGMPFLGDMKPMEVKSKPSGTEPVGEVENSDDLPF